MFLLPYLSVLTTRAALPTPARCNILLNSLQQRGAPNTIRQLRARSSTQPQCPEAAAQSAHKTTLRCRLQHTSYLSWTGTTNPWTTRFTCFVFCTVLTPWSAPVWKVQPKLQVTESSGIVIINLCICQQFCVPPPPLCHSFILRSLLLMLLHPKLLNSFISVLIRPTIPSFFVVDDCK